MAWFSNYWDNSYWYNGNWYSDGNSSGITGTVQVEVTFDITAQCQNITKAPLGLSGGQYSTKQDLKDFLKKLKVEVPAVTGEVCAEFSAACEVYAWHKQRRLKEVKQVQIVGRAVNNVSASSYLTGAAQAKIAVNSKANFAVKTEASVDNYAKQRWIDENEIELLILALELDAPEPVMN